VTNSPTSFAPVARHPDEKLNWWSSIPFFACHLMCLAAFWTGAPLKHVLACIALYYVRMFGVTGVYHRYFAHRAYKTGRVFQFILALLATTSAQKGILCTGSRSPRRTWICSRPTSMTGTTRCRASSSSEARATT
jgi:fatty-acid desaturase